MAITVREGVDDYKSFRMAKVITKKNAEIIKWQKLIWRSGSAAQELFLANLLSPFKYLFCAIIQKSIEIWRNPWWDACGILLEEKVTER